MERFGGEEAVRRVATKLVEECQAHAVLGVTHFLRVRKELLTERLVFMFKRMLERGELSEQNKERLRAKHHEMNISAADFDHWTQTLGRVMNSCNIGVEGRLALLSAIASAKPCIVRPGKA